MEWTYTAPILSLEKNYRFKSLTNKHYQAIIKFCASKDDTGLIEYTQQLLSHLCQDPTIEFSRLPVIDQFFLLTRIRSICIGTRIELTLDDDVEENVKYTAFLAEIQKSINRNYIQPIVIKSDDIEIILHYTSMWEEPTDNSYIKKILIDGTEVQIDTLHKHQINLLLDNLPRDLMRKIPESISILNDSINKMQFLQLPGDRHDICLDSKSYGYYLRTLYSSSIPNFIEQMYVFVKMLNMSLSDALNLSPTDTNLYYQMFVKELQEKEKLKNQAKAKNRNSRDISSRV